MKEKQSLLTSLFIEASPVEARFLTALVLEDMRTGLSEGLLAESIAYAFDVDSALVRRAWSFKACIPEGTRCPEECFSAGDAWTQTHAS